MLFRLIQKERVMSSQKIWGNNPNEELCNNVKSIDFTLLKLEKNFKSLKPIIQELKLIINFLSLNSAFSYSDLEDLSLHMAFSGPSGTGKSFLASKIAEIFYALGYISKPSLLTVSRNDLIGQYVGHTAIKTRDILQKAQGAILFIDDASQLYQDDNEQDFGKECIELLLQIMENRRKDIIIIFSDENKKLSRLFESNPGIASRIAHHFNFQFSSIDELVDLCPHILQKYGYFLVDSSKLENTYVTNILKKSMLTCKNINKLEKLNHKFLAAENNRIYKDLTLYQNSILLKSLVEVNLFKKNYVYK